MANEYKIAFYGAIITLLSFILIGIALAVMGFITRDYNLMGLALASLEQIDIPIIGPLPLLPYEAVLLMAIADVSTSNASQILGLGILGALPFAVGGVMTGYGFYGFYKQEQSTLCLITSLLMMVGFGALTVIIPLGLIPTTIISPWTFLIYHYFAVVIPLTQTTIMGMGLGVAVGLTALIIIVGYILLGVTMIVIRDKTSKPDYMLAAGILSILGGLLFFGIIGIALVFITYILLALVFKELRK
ncbi:MAG: hypothetical protein ACUVXA_17105 [Candidatus Jordarchaeum sp.]|uniref:hypothetical protein n=1 Tax=Candidatus Jordarchaeum sp. TaxID=2823881 RepID=UPI00404B81E6